MLRGTRYDGRAGERVFGVLRVIDHEPAVVNGVFVDRRTEVRVPEARR